jgi:uncharacterized YigZ family protein
MPHLNYIMAEKYLSVYGECTTEKTIEKSRFITTSRHVETEEEAKAFVNEICKKFPEATHNCYAYISDAQGNFLRFSDDGEPQGTAGMPILEVIKNKSLVQAAVVVTRYFGGIKLGAGGLLRAYSGCAAENLESARKVLYEICEEYKICVGYTFVDAAERYFLQTQAEVLDTEFLNNVIFSVAVKKSESAKFCAELLNRLNGKFVLQKTREFFYPFKL